MSERLVYLIVLSVPIFLESRRPSWRGAQVRPVHAHCPQYDQMLVPAYGTYNHAWDGANLSISEAHIASNDSSLKGQ